ncbi:MAG: serine/threonine-protein kinase [Acidobacteriota bacterium]
MLQPQSLMKMHDRRAASVDGRSPAKRPRQGAESDASAPNADDDLSRTRWGGAVPSRPSGTGVAPGDLLADRFQVQERLGRGGMGEVFSAQDTVLGEAVALKVVHPHPSDAQDGFRRLKREVQLARRVTHSNVCRIFDLIQHRGEDGGQLLHLVSMELLRGETLRDRRAHSGSLPVDEALAIIRQIARGLNAAHRYGIVHRDLKPSNVMLVDEAGGLRAAITDFGLARVVGAGTRDSASSRIHELVGTPAYMAPEQIAGEPLSPATDIYSLGLVLYELLAGRLPFSGSSVWELAAQRVSHPPTPIVRYVPDLDATVRALIDRCLARDPAARFASTGQLLNVLDFGDGSWDVYGRKPHGAP